MNITTKSEYKIQHVSEVTGHRVKLSDMKGYISQIIILTHFVQVTGQGKTMRHESLNFKNYNSMAF